MNWNWLFAIVMLGFAAWAVYRGFEAYAFRQFLRSLDGELTNPKLRQFIDQLNTKQVPNSQAFWTQLRELERRVVSAGTVSPDLKAEFRTLLQSKATHF